ncbi:MAG: HNH endonuclease [Oligoflexales bacterium]|nr:HNH endonuclease [Oligoflexales bacterium]
MEISEKQIKEEKEKARKLRKSRWWQNLIQSTVCYYCNTELDSKTATMDHIVPLSRGGRSRRGNVVPSCKTCNTKKRDLTPVEWTEYLDSLKKQIR